MLEHAQETVIYVISEKPDLALLPENCLRVLVSADLSLIRERFAQRMGGVLPPPVAKMLEAKHGMFDGERHDLKLVSGEDSTEAASAKIIALLGK
ncbi:MAG: hypothetical protein ACOYIR_07435 [Christensenellales bacterium]